MAMMMVMMVMMLLMMEMTRVRVVGSSVRRRRRREWLGDEWRERGRRLQEESLGGCPENRVLVSRPC